MAAASCRPNASRDSGRRLVTLISARSSTRLSSRTFHSAVPRAPTWPRIRASGLARYLAPTAVIAPVRQAVMRRRVHDGDRDPGGRVEQGQQARARSAARRCSCSTKSPTTLTPLTPAAAGIGQMAAQHVEVTAIAGHQVHPRLDDRAALAVRADRALDRVDDLGAGEPEAGDVRAGQEAQPQAAGYVDPAACGCSVSLRDWSALLAVVEEDVADRRGVSAGHVLGAARSGSCRSSRR